MDKDTRWKKVSAAQAEEVFREKVAAVEGRAKVGFDWLNQMTLPGLGNHVATTPGTWFGTAFFQKALKGGEPVILTGWGGNLGVPGKNLVQQIPNLFKVRLIQVSERGDGNGTFVFASEEVMLMVSIYEMGRHLDVDMATVSQEVVATATKLFNRVVVPDNPRSGLVFTLSQTMHGYTLRRLGAAGAELERGNYNPEVISAFDHITTDLASPSPCGRLVILSGPPGTGKTWLTRSLLAQVPQAAFVVIPSHLVANLSGPELLPALANAKAEFPGPIVLIVEDADKVLVNRNEGDMSAISSMLNLGDGILGAVLDIRVLATTNATKLDMDPATRRPGRLCRYIEVNPLNAATAAQVFTRLTTQPKVYQEPKTLAEVYQDAREAGWVAPPIANHRPEIRNDIIEALPLTKAPF